MSEQVGKIFTAKMWPMLCKTPFFGSIRARLLTRISIRSRSKDVT